MVEACELGRVCWQAQIVLARRLLKGTLLLFKLTQLAVHLPFYKWGMNFCLFLLYLLACLAQYIHWVLIAIWSKEHGCSITFWYSTGPHHLPPICHLSLVILSPPAMCLYLHAHGFVNAVCKVGPQPWGVPSWSRPSNPSNADPADLR